MRRERELAAACGIWGLVLIGVLMYRSSFAQEQTAGTPQATVLTGKSVERAAVTPRSRSPRMILIQQFDHEACAACGNGCFAFGAIDTVAGHNHYQARVCAAERPVSCSTPRSADGEAAACPCVCPELCPLSDCLNEHCPIAQACPIAHACSIAAAGPRQSVGSKSNPAACDATVHCDCPVRCVGTGPSACSSPIACANGASCGKQCGSEMKKACLAASSSTTDGAEALVDPALAGFLDLIVKHAEMRVALALRDEIDLIRDATRDELLEAIAENAQLRTKLEILEARQEARAKLDALTVENGQLKASLEFAEKRAAAAKEEARLVLENDYLKSQLADLEQQLAEVRNIARLPIPYAVPPFAPATPIAPAFTIAPAAQVAPVTQVAPLPQLPLPLPQLPPVPQATPATAAVPPVAAPPQAVPATPATPSRTR